MLGWVVFAYRVPNVVEALETRLKIAPMMSITMWLAFVWRRVAVAGAWAAAITGFGVWFLTTRQFIIQFLHQLPLNQSLHFIWEEPGKLPAVYEPWTIVFYTSAALLAAVIVSLFTRPVAKEKLDRFYHLMRTPVAPGEHVDEPCTLPAGAKPAERRMLARSFGLEVPLPSRTSIVGFLVGWLMVAALIGGFYLIVKM